MNHTMWISLHNIKAFPNSAQFTLLTMLNVQCISFQFFFICFEANDQNKCKREQQENCMVCFSKADNSWHIYVWIRVYDWAAWMHAIENHFQLRYYLSTHQILYILNDRFLALAFPFSWKLKTFTWNTWIVK